MPRDPVFAISYGQSKVGKTTDNCFSFPNAFYIAQPGALNPSLGVCGFEIPKNRIYDAKDIEDARDKIRMLRADVSVREIVVDDFTFLAEKTQRKFEAPMSEGGLGLSGFTLWGAIYRKVLEFRDEARHAGKHLILNSHEKLPNLPMRRGGPSLPGKLPEAMPAACDLVVRAMMLSPLDAKGRLGWPGVYRCAPWDTTWITGDRNNVAIDNAPMNMAELLRAAGYQISRLPGCEWMEQVVASMAGDLLGGDPKNDKSIAQQYAQFLSQNKVPAAHMLWVIRDALDRAAIRRAHVNPLRALGL